MSQLIKKFVTSRSNNTTRTQVPVCNYNDNYYGDQVCTFTPRQPVNS